MSARLQLAVRTVRCGARRSPRSVLRCESDALHGYGCLPNGVRLNFHAARDRRGAWHFWEVKR